MEKDKKKLLIVSTLINPIPAVNGGAVESLLTNFLYENEKNGVFSIFVISIRNKEAEKISFRNCKVIYIETDAKKFLPKDIILFCFFKIRLLFRKLFFNRITKNIFKIRDEYFESRTFTGYLSYRIYKKVKPDLFMSEGNDKLYQFRNISKKIGPNNCYYHLHFCRNECLRDRRLFANSISVSNFVRDSWVVHKNLDGQNCVIYNGIDLERFNPSKDTFHTDKKRLELGLSKDDFVVCFAARFRPGKGLIELFKAFNQISDNHIKLLLMGGFVDYKKDEEAFKISVEREIQGNDNIVYVGKIKYELINEYYAICNAQVICSTYLEASPLVAIEGMAYGLPLIVTKTGGLTECLTADCSIQLDINDELSTNIANSIILLKNNRELCKKMGSSGKRISEKFSKEHYYNDICLFLNGIKK